MKRFGVTWAGKRNSVATGEYRGFTITVRRAYARTAITGNPWRLCVSKGGGGNLAFDKQFWPTLDDARRRGIRLVDGHPAATGESAKCQCCEDGLVGETDWTGAVHDRQCSECKGNSYV